MPEILSLSTMTTAAAATTFSKVMKTFIHRKYGRYRQDTDMYKGQKQNNNTQYTLQQGSG